MASTVSFVTPDERSAAGAQYPFAGGVQPAQTVPKVPRVTEPFAVLTLELALMGPARATSCSEKEQLINRIRIATDAIIAFSKAEMEAIVTRNPAVEQVLERRILAARQDRAALIASLNEHTKRHQC